MAEWIDYLYENVSNVEPHEPPSDYKPGGFHPVTLHDTFQDERYVVRHKLGFGGQATVWLAWDTSQNQWVSLKIKKSYLSNGSIHDDQEVQAITALENFYTKTGHKEPRCYTRLLDAFQLRGPNGVHNCVVTELVGPSISKLLRTCAAFDEILRPDTVLRATRRLLRSIDFAHRAGVVHGDISFGNVAFTCELAKGGEEDLMFDVLGGNPAIAIYSGHQALPSSMPSHLVKCADWDMWTDRDEEDIRLIDWGLAFQMGQVVASIAQPIDLRSPETFFSAYIDHHHDLWRAGCVIYSLFFQRPPFPFKQGSDDIFIMKMILQLGPLPKEWQPLLEDMQRMNTRPQSVAPHERVEEAFEARRRAIILECADESKYTRDEWSDYDLQKLKFLFRPMVELLRYEPEHRVSAQQAASYIDWIDYRNEA